MSDIRQMKLMSGEEILCDLVDVQNEYDVLLISLYQKKTSKTICDIIHSDRL